MRLPDPTRSKVLLVGTSKFSDSTLSDLPGVANNLADLAELFTSELGTRLPADSCVSMLDELSAVAIGKQLTSLAADAEDLLLVYYAGHGLIGPDGALHLSLPQTEPSRELIALSALPFEWLRRTLATARAANRVVILDCCFSGLAIDAMADAASPVASQFEISGTCTLASSAANRTAVAPAGSRNTAYTGELIELLRSGSPDAPDYLTLIAIHEHLARALPAQGYPAPEQRNTRTVGQLALVRNRARPGPETATPGLEDDLAASYTTLSPIVASMTFRIQRRAVEYADQVQVLHELPARQRHSVEDSALDDLGLHVDQLLDVYDPPKLRRRRDALTFAHLYAEMAAGNRTPDFENPVLVAVLAALLAAEIEFSSPIRLTRTQTAMLAEVYERLAVRLVSFGLGEHAALAFRRAAALYRQSEDTEGEDRCELARARARRMSQAGVQRLASVFVDVICGYGYRPFRMLAWMICQFVLFTALVVSLVHRSVFDVISLCLADYLNPLSLGDTADLPGSARAVLELESMSGTLSTLFFVVMLARRWLRGMPGG